MKVDVLLGLQWGDEGKGKVVDVLTPRYDVVARFQGGPNAGHTLEFEGKKYVLRSIPSGIFQHGQVNIIGNGVVLDPVLFREEAEDLEKSGVDIKKILKISKKAHLIMPTHRLLDAANEKLKGSSKIGTTGKGIGPTYTDKVSRNGLRVGDIFHNFEEKYAAAKARHVKMLEMLDAISDFSELEAIPSVPEHAAALVWLHAASVRCSVFSRLIAHAWAAVRSLQNFLTRPAVKYATSVMNMAR